MTASTGPCTLLSKMRSVLASQRESGVHLWDTHVLHGTAGLRAGQRALVHAATTLEQCHVSQKHDSVQVGRFALVTERVGTGDCSTPGRPSLRPLREHAIKQFERLWAAKLVHGDVAARNLTIDSTGQVIILDLGLARPATPEAIARERDQVERIFS
jgi:hypothetical protein